MIVDKVSVMAENDDPVNPQAGVRNTLGDLFLWFLFPVTPPWRSSESSMDKVSENFISLVFSGSLLVTIWHFLTVGPFDVLSNIQTSEAASALGVIGLLIALMLIISFISPKQLANTPEVLHWIFRGWALSLLFLGAIAQTNLGDKISWEEVKMLLPILVGLLAFAYLFAHSAREAPSVKDLFSTPEYRRAFLKDTMFAVVIYFVTLSVSMLDVLCLVNEGPWNGGQVKPINEPLPPIDGPGL